MRKWPKKGITIYEDHDIREREKRCSKLYFCARYRFECVKGFQERPQDQTEDLAPGFLEEIVSDLTDRACEKILLDKRFLEVV